MVPSGHPASAHELDRLLVASLGGEGAEVDLGPLFEGVVLPSAVGGVWGEGVEGQQGRERDSSQ